VLVRKKESEILQSLSYFPVVGVLGPRQCGKTTVVKQLASMLSKPTIYLDMESSRDRSVLNDPELYFGQHHNECIIIDEIQLYPELFPILRSSIDQNKKPARFIILGSSSPKLLRKSNESLAGRVSYHELTPFMLTEIDNEIKHRIWGGYPDCFLTDSDHISSEWLTNYIQSYTERELPQMGLNTSPSNIFRLLKMIAHLHSQLLNINQLSKSLGISATSVKNYIDFLSEAFLIRLLPPYYQNSKKRLVKAPKIYIRDTGVFHSLAGVSNQRELEFHPQLGDSWEGYVVEQIINHLPHTIEPLFYRTQHGNEIDLVLIKGTVVFAAIEIKNTLSPKPSRGFHLSIEELKPQKKVFVVHAQENYQLEKDIYVMGLREAINWLV
jgi:predicted AAA+ superfamily ATPase